MYSTIGRVCPRLGRLAHTYAKTSQHHSVMPCRARLSNGLSARFMSSDRSHTVAQIKELRKVTSAKMIDCRNAIAECNGDLDAAIAWLRERGAATTLRDGRVSSEGAIGVAVSDDWGCGTIVELNCETDFVARGESFNNLLKNITASFIPVDEVKLDEELVKTLPSVDTSAPNVGTAISNLIYKVGENIVIARSDKLKASTADGVVGAYSHGNGSLGAMVTVEASGGEGGMDEAAQKKLRSLAKDLAVQAVAHQGDELDATSFVNEEFEFGEEGQTIADVLAETGSNVGRKLDVSGLIRYKMSVK
eukprot:TRINITY_DN5191_c0_g1_i1.p1 TRINITY_DN5191_c0_g1~~TRINITY_DN5191_c0_g1_i1.p1  ORF type:complete len:305 (+),score=66.93 TRINITY_DN5191_c0_g1_i1:69-983(+)